MDEVIEQWASEQAARAPELSAEALRDLANELGLDWGE